MCEFAGEACLPVFAQEENTESGSVRRLTRKQLPQVDTTDGRDGE